MAPWRADPRVQLHGPGWSKVVLGADAAGDWREHLALVAESVAANGGRSCINASGVWTTAGGRDLALGLAEELAKIEARPLDDPRAQLAAFPTVESARKLSEYIDARLAIPGAEDLTARFRGDRVAEVDGCGFVPVAGRPRKEQAKGWPRRRAGRRSEFRPDSRSITRTRGTT